MRTKLLAWCLVGGLFSWLAVLPVWAQGDNTITLTAREVAVLTVIAARETAVARCCLLPDIPPPPVVTWQAVARRELQAAVARMVAEITDQEAREVGTEVQRTDPGTRQKVRELLKLPATVVP